MAIERAEQSGNTEKQGINSDNLNEFRLNRDSLSQSLSDMSRNARTEVNPKKLENNLPALELIDNSKKGKAAESQKDAQKRPDETRKTESKTPEAPQSADKKAAGSPDAKAGAPTDTKVSAVTDAKDAALRDANKAGAPTDAKPGTPSDAKPGAPEAVKTAAPADAKAGAGRKEVGADKQEVTFDANNQVSEIKYPNGMNVKLQRDINGQITQADITGGGATVDGSYRKNGESFDRYNAAGQKTGQTITKVDIRKDGQAEIKAKVGVFSGTSTVDTKGKVAIKPDLF